MYASTCIYMCCNTKRNIMKNQVGCPDLGSRGKSLCLSVLCFMISLLFIFCYNIRVDNLCSGLKPTFGIGVVSASRGRLCC